MHPPTPGPHERPRRPQGPAEPSPWVLRHAWLVPAGGTVADLACGGGRHTRLFLERGHPVVAVDADVRGVADLAGRPDVEVVKADLEHGFPLTGRQFAGVVVTNYLHRPILGDIVGLVAPGGALIYETFSREHARVAGRPSNPDFLLEPDELLDAVGDRLRVVAFEDVVSGPPVPAAVQRIAAVRDARR